jgi:hypothetical protein
MFNYYHKNSVHNECSAIFGTIGIKVFAYVIILQYEKQIYIQVLNTRNSRRINFVN